MGHVTCCEVGKLNSKHNDCSGLLPRVGFNFQRDCFEARESGGEIDGKHTQVAAKCTYEVVGDDTFFFLLGRRPVKSVFL